MTIQTAMWLCQEIQMLAIWDFEKEKWLLSSVDIVAELIGSIDSGANRLELN